MKKIFIILLIIQSIAYGQKKFCSNRKILLSDYKVSFTPRQLNFSSIINLDKGFFIVIKLKNYRGEMEVEYFNPDSLLLVRGQYCSSLGLLKKYSNITNISPPYNEEVIIEKYFLPLKHGLWTYFDKGEILNIERWNKGIKK